MSHIQNLEVNKVTSTKQVSEAGNHDMPQRALRGGGKQKKKKTHLHCSLQSFILMQGREAIFHKHESHDRCATLPDYSE